jgi:hypothetical protein
MSDDLLATLDERIAAVRDRAGTSTNASPGALAAHARFRPIEQQAAADVSLRDRWPWVEWFVYAQFLWGALLFVPGAQAYRPLIRALPYATSVGLLALYVTQRTPWIKAPGSASFMIAALAVLVANLLHPTTQFLAGAMQCVFQLMIAAPVFWAWKAVHDEQRLLRIVRLVFLLNVLSAGVGALQVYMPDVFLPPQFSALGLQLSDTWVDELSYEGAGGRTIVRPPGLTDQPGAASVAGTIAAVLGLGLTLLARTTATRVSGVGGAALGLFVLYLTQVRSLLLMCVAAFALMAALMFRRGRFAAGTWLLAGGATLVLSAFFWAVSVGGERVEQRFIEMTRRGAVQTYRENRGHFLSYTVGELLDEYPLGAGVGRWGMMYIYFGDPTNLAAPPIYVEIQPTGWLLDGGVPLWICYGGAILAAFATAWRLAAQRFSPAMADIASLVLPVLLAIVGMSLAGPIFNTQVGILFWFLVGSLYGAGNALVRRRVRHAVEGDDPTAAVSGGSD